MTVIIMMIVLILILSF